MYAKYSKDFRNTVDRVFGEEYQELADQLRANVSRFAAYKSNYVKTAFEDNSKAFSGDDLKAANEASKNQFCVWTETELATASARARTAKQFSEFNEPDRKELFPCLKWLPSRAANPRITHRQFWDGVWRKDDDFWKRHQPGTEWGCMCDIEECDDEPKEPKDYSRKKEPKVPKGLDGNPSVTGEIFTDKVGYIRKADDSVEKLALKIVRKDNSIWAKENLKSCKHPEVSKEIVFSSNGIDEYLNQNHDNYYIKNEAIRRMPQIIEKSEFKGITNYKGRISYIFETQISGKVNYLIANLQDDGVLRFYSISESEKVLIGIKK